ncbi:hypothetical protein BU23DRAFT_480954, partial [Bimuria novae-zelandiae CBS 107.79]
AITARKHCSRHAISNVMENLKVYGTNRRPVQGKLGRPPAISDEDGEALFDELVYSS